LRAWSIVDPRGGLVRTVNVAAPVNQKTMGLIKVGDTIAAVIREAVVVSVEPTR